MSNKASRYSEGQKRINVLRVTASEIKAFKVRRKIFLTLLAAIVTLTGLLYMASALHRDMGRLSVGINKADMTRYGLTLSEFEDMRECTSRLNAEINERITNISRNDLPADEILLGFDGQHNGDEYIAYTFYLEHRGTDVMDYEYEVTIGNVSLGLDDAMRVRLYIGDEGVEYAKLSAENTPEPYSTPFHSTGVITRGLVEDFAPGDKVKYTIVIWLEGDDPECVDRVIDGMAKVEMNFKAIPKDE